MTSKFRISKKSLHNLLGVSLIIYFIIGIIWGLIKEKRLEEGPSAYTIAVITRLRSGSRVPPWFEYKFELHGKLYKSTYSIADNNIGRRSWEELKHYVGKRFYIKFYIPNPNNNRLQIYKPVPCNIKKAPSMGWKKIPAVGILPYCE
jgi:hypothetical protein